MRWRERGNCLSADRRVGGLGVSPIVGCVPQVKSCQLGEKYFSAGFHSRDQKTSSYECECILICVKERKTGRERRQE